MTKECPNCGEKNPDNSSFCKNCGNDLKEVTKVQKSSKSGLSGWWGNQTNVVKGLSVVGVCCVGLILLLFIGSIVFPDTSTTTSTPSSSSTSTPSVSSLETFTGSGVSFQYPKEWTEYTPESVKATEIVNLKTTNGGNSVLTVYKEDDSGEDVDYWKSVYLSAIPNSGAILISQKDINIAGVSGFRIDSSYNTDGSSGEQSIIGFVKNGNFYNLLFTTKSINAINSDIDTIVNSFKTT